MNSFIYKVSTLCLLLGSCEFSAAVKCYDYFSTTSPPPDNYTGIKECFNGNDTVATCTKLIFTYDDGTNTTTTYLAGCEQLFRRDIIAFCEQQKGDGAPGFKIVSCMACRANDLCNIFDDDDDTAGSGKQIVIDLCLALIAALIFLVQ